MKTGVVPQDNQGEEEITVSRSRGRPLTSTDGTPRSKVVKVYMTEAEKARLRERAAAQNMDVSEYVLKTLFGDGTTDIL
jgi:hypothetical protein